MDTAAFLLELRALHGDGKTLPRRPSTLMRADHLATGHVDEIIARLLEDGKAAAYGGVSLIGGAGHIVSVLGILQVQEGGLVGWAFSMCGSMPEETTVDRVDTRKGAAPDNLLPNTLVYFAGMADEKLIAEDLSHTDFAAAARFIMAFMSDDGPPRGIDW